MNFKKINLFLKFIQYTINTSISYLFLIQQSEKGEYKIPNIFKLIIKENIIEPITKKSIFIIPILFVICFLIELYLIFGNKYRKDKKLYENICFHIYEYLEKQSNHFNCNIGITIFEKMKENTDNVYIESVGRYDILEPKKKIKIKFKPNENTAGKCFAKQMVIYEKCSETLCIPIKYTYKNKTWGVLCIDGVSDIDSEQGNKLKINRDNIRKIEEIFEHYKVFLENYND
jgi:hypothetical protein